MDLIDFGFGHSLDISDLLESVCHPGISSCLVVVAIAAVDHCSLMRRRMTTRRDKYPTLL